MFFAPPSSSRWFGGRIYDIQQSKAAWVSAAGRGGEGGEQWGTIRMPMNHSGKKS